MGWSIHHPVGLIYYSPMLSYKGYTLVSSNTANFAVLVDMEGRICHRWEYHGGIAYAKVLLNGNLLIRTWPDPDYEETRGLGGASASLVELDWNGVKVWEYNDPALHHDYERLLNGNTIYLRWESMPADLSIRVRGGYRTPEDPINVLGDTIREVSPDGETVGEWRTWENLSVEEDVICPLEGRREWTHANALSSAKDGDFLVSYRQTDTVAIFSRETGEASMEVGPRRDQPPAQRDPTRQRQHHDIRQRRALQRRQKRVPDHRGKPGERRNRVDIRGQTAGLLLQFVHQRRGPISQREHADMRGRAWPDI